MNYFEDTLFDNPEEMITCPYDQHHTVTAKRMIKHLIRCRENNKEKLKEMVECTFDRSHCKPKIEINFHEKYCNKRGHVYNVVYTCSNSKVVNELVEKNVMVPSIEIDTGENWDEDDGAHRNVLQSIQESGQNKRILRCNSNKPPAVRKQLREEQRRAYNNFRDNDKPA